MLRNLSSVACLTLGRILLPICLAAVPMALAFAIEPVMTNEPSRQAAAKSSGEPTPRMHGVDLSYVPSAAWAFVAMRPAEMLKAAELPELKTLIEERCGPTFGKLRLPVTKIAQITWVPASRDIVQEPRPGNLVIYQMTEPYDFRELIRAELPSATKQDYQVQAGYVAKTGLTWSGFFPTIDGQEVWCDWYQQPARLTGLKDIVDAYRKVGKPSAAKTEAETKRKTASYYIDTDAAGTKRFVLVPDERTIVFARSSGALEEIFGSDEMVWRPYVEPGKDRAVLLVWGARRGGPRFLPAERKQWQTVRDDHLALWAVRQPMELIKGWPGYPEFIDYGASPFNPILKYVPTAIGMHLDGQMRIRASIVAPAESNRQFASSLEASLKLAAAMGEMYRGDVKLAEESIRPHYMKLIEDYLGLLKNVKVTADGDVLRADTSADVSALKNALSLLAAKYLPSQHGPTPKSDR